MGFFWIAFSLSYFFSFSLFSFQVLFWLQSSMSFLLVSLLILSSYLFLNIVMTQAHREDLQAIPLVKSVIQDLRATKNRQTRIFQFNGIFIQSSSGCSKQDRGLSLLGTKVILNIQTQVQVFMGGILWCFFCLAYRIPPLFKHPIKSMVTYYEIQYASSFTRNNNILNIYFSLVSDFFEPKTWHGD